jgi:hypothetical protein
MISGNYDQQPTKLDKALRLLGREPLARPIQLSA